MKRSTLAIFLAASAVMNVLLAADTLRLARELGEARADAVNARLAHLRDLEEFGAKLAEVRTAFKEVKANLEARRPCEP